MPSVPGSSAIDPPAPAATPASETPTPATPNPDSPALNSAPRHRSQELLSVGQVAQRGGVSVSALHFYERQKLIFSVRTSGNQRRFERSVLRRVAVIRAAQRAGIPLALVAGVFEELPEHGIPSQADWQRLSEHWRDELDARITALEKLRGSLGKCIGCGCLSLAECGFVNPDDRVASQGPGARAFDDPL